MMAKFKKGDRVRCVKRDYSGERFYEIGEEAVVDSFTKSVFNDTTGGVFYNDRWELAAPSPIPDIVTIGGVEYVRKPEPEHVWAWGQWARVNTGGFKGLRVFVTGEVNIDGFVPVTYKDRIRGSNIGGFYPAALTYISTATIPE